MAKTEQSRQKKLAKKRSKEIAKRKRLASEKNALKSIVGQIAAASRMPIERCYAYDSLFDAGDELGIGAVLVTRPIPDGRIVFACFLVDKTCLGVKDSYARLVGPSQFTEYLDSMRTRSSVSRCDPTIAKKLVTDSVKWAAQFGLPPRGDYDRVSRIWSDVDETQCDQTFQFGRDGKPCLIQGPHDSPAFMAQVMNTLAEHAGEGNYQTVARMDGFASGDDFFSGDDDDSFAGANEIELPSGQFLRIDDGD